jgi:hypothetical protein
MNETRRKCLTATLLGVILFIPMIASAQYQRWPGIPEITMEIRKEKSVFVPMRDSISCQCAIQ